MFVSGNFQACPGARLRSPRYAHAMTAPDAAPSSVPPATTPEIRAVDGNRAALTLLLVQNVVSAILIGLRVPLGVALLFVALGVVAHFRDLGLGNGNLLLGMGALMLAGFFLVPLLSAEQRAQRRAGPRR